MELCDAWPPFGLRIEAGPLVLRPIDDEMLPRLIELALDGIHAPETMPFATPWTDAPADELPANYVQYVWGVRANWKREKWNLEFAVENAGELVGVQAFFSSDYRVTRTGETGSWLGSGFQGRGIGTAMRQALCAFLFDHLDFEFITSVSFEDNPGSLRVSEKLGYRDNGIAWSSPRGTRATSRRLLLLPEDFVRGEPITVEGAEPLRRFIGLEQAPD